MDEGLPRVPAQAFRHPVATDSDFRRACDELQIDMNADTGRMGIVVALARLQRMLLANGRALNDLHQRLLQLEGKGEGR